LEYHRMDDAQCEDWRKEHLTNGKPKMVRRKLLQSTRHSCRVLLLMGALHIYAQTADFDRFKAECAAHSEEGVLMVVVVLLLIVGVSIGVRRTVPVLYSVADRGANRC
jgi:hypothetical protein